MQLWMQLRSFSSTSAFVENRIVSVSEHFNNDLSVHVIIVNYFPNSVQITFSILFKNQDKDRQLFIYPKFNTLVYHSFSSLLCTIFCKDHVKFYEISHSF